VPVSDAIRRFAEEPGDELPEPWLPGRRIIRPRFTLALSPSTSLSHLSRVRTTEEELDATIAEARAILRDFGYTACAWNIGPSARPLGLARLLAARGFVPAAQPPYEARFTVMALTAPPPEPAPDARVEARLVRSLDEYLRAFRAGLVASDLPEALLEELVTAAPAGWEHESGVAKMTHLALVDGRVAGLGMVSAGPSAHLLGGGAVLPAFRGRGVYRALVASRWRAAVAAGKPALVVHAGAMSRPILARCGFEEVCQLELLLDPML
jgi:hypothetical protein